jgi:D-beta-D-heptose 7-phosphate kinase/D-beta-D-heptose 1-phosphate adenosyltransferase
VTSADIARFARCRILVVGDVMLDHFIWGGVRRISPEAPVPVVEVTKETWYPGGAANVARNVAPFGAKVSIMGRVGHDSQAQQLRELMHEEGVNCEPLLVSETVPTISKARVIARQQQIVRVDRETIQKLTEAELTEIAKRLEVLAKNLDAIIIEDYGKGFITEPLLRLVTNVAKDAKLLVTVDPSPRNPIRWSGVNLVKPNRSEAFAAAGIDDLHDDTPPEQNEQMLQVGSLLLEKWDVPMILITLGEQGMMLFQRGEAPHHIPTRAREVFDVSGAGDTAIAVLTMALASGMNPQQAAEAANYASGIVVGKLGTATLTPEELLNACSTSPAA